MSCCLRKAHRELFFPRSRQSQSTGTLARTKRQTQYLFLKLGAGNDTPVKARLAAPCSVPALLLAWGTEDEDKVQTILTPLNCVRQHLLPGCARLRKEYKGIMYPRTNKIVALGVLRDRGLPSRNV